MKRGKQVAVCQDGKWGRAVLGTIIKTSNGNKILVRFTPSGTDTVAEAWFRCSSCRTNFGGPRRKWSGWAQLQMVWCPWFTIVPLKRLRSAGFKQDFYEKLYCISHAEI